MEKLYNIESVLVSDGYLTLLVNGIELKIKLSEISTKLNNASKEDQNNLKISPLGMVYIGLKLMKIYPSAAC